MRNFFEKVKDILLFTIIGLFWGFIGGIIVSMTIFTARHKPFWCLGFTAFFILFHLSDFQKFFADKNWMAGVGRFIALFTITSFIVSLFVFSFGAFERLDIFDIFAFIISMPLSIFAVTFWVLLKQYGRQTRLYIELAKIVDGLHVLGVLWKY